MAIAASDTVRPAAHPGRATAILAATVACSVAVSVLGAIAWPELAQADAVLFPLNPVGSVVFAALGTLILRRARNRIGWVLLTVGFVGAVDALTSVYALLGVTGRFGLPAAALVGAISEALFVPVALAISYVLLIFPTGEVASPRWRAAEVSTVVAAVLLIVAFVVTPRDVAIPAPGGVSATYPNPTAIDTLRGTFVGTLPGIGVVSGLLLVVSVAALIVRYRSGHGVLRQQIKWIAFAAVVMVLSQLGVTACLIAFGPDAPMTFAVGAVSGVVTLLGLPAAITIAILRYGLYEIDLIINRAVVYGLLAATLTALYVAVVAAVGTLVGYAGSPPATVAAAVAVAVAFQPLRTRARRVANRIVYGERATPYEVLSSFADTITTVGSFDEQLDRTVSLVASGTGATRVEIWIRVAASMRRAAAWPADAAPSTVPDDADGSGSANASAVVPIRHEGDQLGLLVVVKPRNEELSPSEAALIEHVASQAGLLVRNVGLTAQLRQTIEELRASRRRLVEAQDAERRKIERNLHDGAQQELVALGLRLSLLERLARGSERHDALLEGIASMRTLTDEALENLRDLARGIFPPLLADRGLVAALEAQATRMPIPTAVEAVAVDRYAREAEAAVYFCVREALQNVSKYAEATSVVIWLSGSDAELSFEVRDDGRGFDPSSARGSGLQGMADRLDAIGGTFELKTARGHGTAVRGTVPATPPRSGV